MTGRGKGREDAPRTLGDFARDVRDARRRYEEAVDRTFEAGEVVVVKHGAHLAVAVVLGTFSGRVKVRNTSTLREYDVGASRLREHGTKPVPPPVLTPDAARIARHALGWPKCYRNRYIAPIGTPVFSTLEAMEEDGFARRAEMQHDGDSLTFYMTDAAVHALRRLEAAGPAKPAP